MIDTITIFVKKMFSISRGVVIWLLLLMFINMVIPIFYLNNIEAQSTLIAFMTGVLIFKAQGFTHLLGAMHWTWIPLIIFFLVRLPLIPASDFFGIWLRVLIILNSLSLIPDTAGVIKYIQGDRKLLH